MADWSEILHPRDRRGEWRDKPGLVRTAEQCSHIIEAGGDSRDGFVIKHPDGGYSFRPERDKLHADIVHRFMGSVPPASEGQQIAVFTAGGPAAGKTTILDRLVALGSDPIPAEHVNVSADEVKPLIPEYPVMLQAHDARAAVFVHHESSVVAARLRFDALASGRNILVDGTGNGDDGVFATLINNTLTKGVRARVIYVDVPIDEAIRRADLRTERTGRLVPHDVLREKHHRVARNFIDVAKIPQVQLELWNNDGVPPTLIARKDSGGVLQILYRPLFEQFLAKGDVTWQG